MWGVTKPFPSGVSVRIQSQNDVKPSWGEERMKEY